jgi:hypothetical protein
MERITRKNFTLVFMIVAVAFLAFPGASSENLSATRLWPLAARMATREIQDKYGRPDVTTNEFLVWKKRGPWEKITVSRTGTLHRFPFEHYDVLEQTLSYRVPIEKLNDIIIFDGSLVIDRTRGTISARCDRESSNILSLNLAHQISIGQLSVKRARFEYGRIIRDKRNGADPVMMRQLAFVTPVNSADPDINITGLNSTRPAGSRKNWLSRVLAARR